MDKHNAVLTALKTIYNKVNIKTTEEDQVVKAVETRQNTKSKIATDTLADIIEYKFESVKKEHDESDKTLAYPEFGVKSVEQQCTAERWQHRSRRPHDQDHPHHTRSL